MVDAGPHPNPRKAAEGFRLRVLTVEAASAAVVRRIFAEYLDGSGDRVIANGLNRDGVPCPSARRPDQNRHRLPDGWQGGTVRSISDNPRYTGYAVFGRWTRHEVLADPDDVAAGHVTRFRRADPDQVVRSRTQARPAIVSVETFTRTQLLRRSRAAGGLEGRRRVERGLTPAKHAYVLRALARCGYCARKMEGTPKHGREYYRCVARRLAPGSPALATHPKAVHLAERAVLPALNAWIGELFDRDNIDRTVAALLGSQEGRTDRSSDRDAVKRRLADTETRLSRLRAAIEAGADPAALIASLDAAQEQRGSASRTLGREAGSVGPERGRGLRDGRLIGRHRSVSDQGRPGADAEDLQEPALGTDVRQRRAISRCGDQAPQGLVGVSEGHLAQTPPRGSAIQAAYSPLGLACTSRLSS